MAADAVGQLRTVEAVLMLLQGPLVFGHAPGQVQSGADQGGVVGVAQSVVGRAAGLDGEQLHGGFQGLLGIGAVGLGVEDHLGVVPLPGPVRGKLEQSQIFPQNGDVVKAPGEEHRLLPAPGPKRLHSLGEGDPLLLQPGLLDAGELADPLVQAAVKLRPHHDLKFIRHGLVLQQPDGADLDDLPPDLHRQRLSGGGGTGPGLVPLHI